MRFSLSTNWINRRIESGEEIVDRALELGFGELELGYHTTLQQAEGFRRRLDEMPVGSIHAFCPVPISAPQGYPELYQLASEDAETRAMARVHILRNIDFAASMGADTVVLHAGRVFLDSLFGDRSTSRLRTVLASVGNDIAKPAYAKALAKSLKLRAKRGAKMLTAFRKTLDEVLPRLQEKKVTLALENLPYLEGFPDETEMRALLDDLKDAPLKAWFDTGHHRVRASFGWVPEGFDPCAAIETYAGVHINDVVDFNDDHFAPGGGRVDFAALKPLLHGVRHLVFEPNAAVKENDLRRGVDLLKRLMAP